jgi:quercetin dioxygenase-like cupin family protein
MHIVHHVHLDHLHTDGESQLLAADHRLGLRHFEVRLSSLDPGAHGPQRRHDGELVVVVLAGQGKLLIDGGPQRFAAPCTLIIPPATPYQLANHGAQPLETVIVFTSAPTALDGVATAGP